MTLNGPTSLDCVPHKIGMRRAMPARIGEG
jgi:hypothetical protein